MPPPSLRQRMAHLVLNSVVFGLCYTSANHFAHTQGVQRSVALAWDMQMAFLPWMVLPYMLSGPFFVGSFWAVRAQDALRVLSQRLLLATVLACLVFVVLPLRFSLERPALPSPLWSALYGLLAILDRPYNQLPSLHVAYCCIFWSALRERHRLLLALTLGVVALSTVFTYQHHLLDVPTGALLGLGCIAWVRPGRSQPWVAFYYGLGAGVVVVLGWVWAPWWITAYGAISLLLVTRAYVVGDADFLHKRHGRFPWWSWLLHAPYLLGYYLTWRVVQWRECEERPWTPVRPLLWVGRRLNDDQIRALPAHCTVIDVANELCEQATLRTIRYHHVAMLDLVEPDPVAVERVIALVHEALQCGQAVYLHCAMGYRRSRQLAAAYLARYPDPLPH
ncbi:MAG: hypothetical protein ACT4NV_10750 [Rhodoferax sp.]